MKDTTDKFEEYVALLNSVKKGELDLLEALQRLNLQLDSNGPLEVRTLRATDGVMSLLKALAVSTYGSRRRAIQMTLKQALMLLLASLNATSPEELWYAREFILRGRVDKEGIVRNIRTGTALPETEAPEKVIKLFKRIVDDIQTRHQTNLDELFSVSLLIRGIKSVRGGVDKRTVQRWVEEFHKWGLVEYYVKTVAKGIQAFDDVVGLIENLALDIASKYEKQMWKESLRNEIRKIGVLLAPVEARIIMDSAGEIYESDQTAGQRQGLVELKYTVQNALYKTIVKYPDLFLVRITQLGRRL